MTQPTDRDAEAVSAAISNGPDMAEFVSDYVQMTREAGTPTPTAEEIAYAWAERAVPDACPDHVYQDVVDSVKPQIEYYL